MVGTTDLAIELGETATHWCPCCERESETVHGYIWDPTGTTSVYFAGYTQGHPELRANLLLSVGGWGEGTTPADRRAFALQVVASNQELTFTFPEPETSPWYGDELLGANVDPQQISQKEREEVRDLARFAIENDQRVAQYLELGDAGRCAQERMTATQRVGK